MYVRGGVAVKRKIAVALILASVLSVASCEDEKSGREKLPKDKPTAQSTKRTLYKVIGKSHKDGEYTLIVEETGSNNPPFPMVGVVAPVYQGCQVGETFTLRADGTPSCGIGN